jgi:hypothetical protein
MSNDRTNPKLLKHSIHVHFDAIELNRLRQLSTRNKMSMTQYIRMLIARDWGDYKSQEQKDLEFFGITRNELTDRQTE